jgi:sugar lactone lactonase YvrE
MTGRRGIDVLARIGGDLLEGPAWDAANDRVLLVDIMGMRRHAVDWTTGTVTSHVAEETTTAWIPRAMGGTVVVARRGLALADDDGEGNLAVEIEADRPHLRSNDAKCDPSGRLWVGTMADDETPAAGSLYRVDPDLSLAHVLDGTTISNGLGWSLDGRRMYFVDSPTQRVDVLAFDPERGTPSARTTFVDTRPFPGMPDGLTVDAEGCLWVAMHDGGMLLRLSSDGRHRETLEVPVARPTSCCFAGPALDLLVITTARGPDGTGGDLLVCEPGVAGAATIAFAG